MSQAYTVTSCLGLDPKVRLYRGRPRIGLMEQRHQGVVHPRPLRSAGSHAHDDADDHQEDGYGRGSQNHRYDSDIGDYVLPGGVSCFNGPSEAIQNGAQL